MFPLIKFELKKLFTYRLILILLVVLTAINVYLMTQEITDQQIQKEEILDMIVSDYIADPKGMEVYIDSYMEAYERAFLLSDKTLIPENRYTEEADILFYESDFFPLRDYTENYQKTVGTAIRIAEGHISEYRFLGYAENSFEIEYQKGVIASYQKLSALTFPFVNIRGYDLLLSYDGFGALAMIAVLIGGMLILIPERNEKSMDLIRVSKYGGTATFGAKMVTAFVYTFVVSGLLTVSAVMAVGVRIGLYGLFAPLQMVESYRLSPLMTNILGGLLAAFLLRVFSSYVFMVLVIAFTSLISGYVPAFLSGLFVMITNYFVASKEYFNAYDPLKNLNFFWSINGKEPLVYWRGLRFFGHCIGTTEAILVVYSCLLLLGCVVAWYCYVRNHGIAIGSASLLFRRFRGIIQIRLPEKKKRNRATLFGMELKKQITPFSIFVMVAVILLTVFICHDTYHTLITFDEMIYDEYISTYEGKWTSEKDEALRKEYGDALSLIAKKEKMARDFADGKLSITEYQIYQTASAKAESRIEILEELSLTSERLRTLSTEGKDAYFVNERGWRKLYDADMSFLYLLASILLFSGMFASDHKDNFVQIRRTAKKGGMTVALYRILIACTMVVIMVTLCEWMQYSDIGRTIGFSLPEASAESLSFLKAEGLSVGGYFGFVFARQIIFSIGFTLLTLFISKKTKAYLPTLAIMTILAFAPTIFGYFGFDLLNEISFVRLLGHQ